MTLLKLFISFLRIGFFSFGGAYSFLPLWEKEAVQNYQWVEKQEFLEVVGMAKVIPGALSIKFATYTGYKVAGVPGVIVANVANLIPPILLIILASVLYSRYKDVPLIKAVLQMIQYAIFALIIAVAIQVVDKNHFFQLRYLIVMVVSFALFFWARIHPAFIIIAAGLFGAIIR